MKFNAEFLRKELVNFDTKGEKWSETPGLSNFSANIMKFSGIGVWKYASSC